MNTTTGNWISWSSLRRVSGRQRPRPARDRLWAAVCGDCGMGRNRHSRTTKRGVGGCVPQVPGSPGSQNERVNRGDENRAG